MKKRLQILVVGRLAKILSWFLDRSDIKCVNAYNKLQRSQAHEYFFYAQTANRIHLHGASQYSQGANMLARILIEVAESVDEPVSELLEEVATELGKMRIVNAKLDSLEPDEIAENEEEIDELLKEAGLSKLYIEMWKMTHTR